MSFPRGRRVRSWGPLDADALLALPTRTLSRAVVNSLAGETSDLLVADLQSLSTSSVVTRAKESLPNEDSNAKSLR